jgi:hypothetical protein
MLVLEEEELFGHIPDSTLTMDCVGGYYHTIWLLVLLDGLA